MIALLGAVAAVLVTIVALRIIGALVVAGATRSQAITAVVGYTVGVAFMGYGLIPLL